MSTFEMVTSIINPFLVRSAWATALLCEHYHVDVTVHLSCYINHISCIFLYFILQLPV